MTRFARATALRSTALATALAISLALAPVGPAHSTDDQTKSDGQAEAQDSKSQSSKSQGSKSQGSKSEAAKSEAAKSADHAKPKASAPPKDALPKAALPKTASPKTVESKAAQQKPSEHKPSEHKTSEHKTSEPKAAASKTELKTEQLKTEKPETSRPKTAQPKTAAPATRPAAGKTTSPAAAAAAKELAPVALTPPVAAPAAPARQRVVAPTPARKPVLPAAVAATMSTSRADLDALESVIEQVRKHSPDDATQTEATISDPVARKLAEWIILRSDNNNATVERYRAFITANPSWPSQTFLRRRLEAALWDDRREDAVVSSWFEKESPVSAKGRFALARTLLARGDRGNAERLVREAWRSDPMSEDTENTALDMFGALLSGGDQKARMDTLLYTTENEAAAMRAAKRLGAGYVALAKARLASVKKAANTKALLDAVPPDLHGDTGYLFSKIQLLRRDEKFAEAAQLMLGAPRDPARLHNLDEWWIERRLLARKMIDAGEYRSAYLIARDAALPTRDIYKTEQEFTAGWIALRFLNDPHTAAQHFARIGVGSVNPTTLARAGYWQGRAAEAAGRTQEARAAYTSAAEQSTSYYGQLARAKLGLPRLDLNEVPRSRGAERLEIVRAAQLLFDLDEREIAIPIFADAGENGDPDALVGLGELTARHGYARGMLLVGKAALNRGLPFDFYAYPVTGIPPYSPIGADIE